MKFEAIFLKYTHIFNCLGESCVMPSDFQLAPYSIKKRIFSSLAVFISLFLLVIPPIFHLKNMIKTMNYYDSTRVVNYLFIISFIMTKLMCIIQMSSWLSLHPELYSMFKVLQRITESKYQMNFKNVHIEFVNESKKILMFCLAKAVINLLEIGTAYFINICYGVLRTFLIRITLFHVYFYVLILVIQNFIENSAFIYAYWIFLRLRCTNIHQLASNYLILCDLNYSFHLVFYSFSSLRAICHFRLFCCIHHDIN